MPKYGRNRIVVPQRPIQGGFDMKFESDPYDVELYGIMTQEQYTMGIDAVNRRLKPSRSGVIDKGLLVTGVLLVVPLALWGIRHSNQTRRRKRLLKKAIVEFQAQFPELLIRWNRRPESVLTIERQQRLQQQPESPQAMAEAQLIGHLVVHVEPIHTPIQQAPAPAPAPARASNTPCSQSAAVSHPMV